MLNASPQRSRAITEGTAVPLRGNDIDTDRIIPARFAKAPTFDALGNAVFADDRVALERAGSAHPFDDPRHAAATILLVNANFGCGSSREHAIAALMRWRGGIRALVGESFAEIFVNNCVANGVPTAKVSASDVEALMRLAEDKPDTQFRLDLAALAITGGGLVVPVSVPDGIRSCLIDGSWDTLAGLLAQVPRIRTTADRLPYLHGFAPRANPPASGGKAQQVK
jgi:3-isopropylmalate/(R)-2-methylmalate dehydratase small subunit